MCTLEVICDYQKTRKRYTEMLKAKFGIEIEFTGITRTKAAEIMANHFASSFTSDGGFYDKKTVVDNVGRKWTVMYDGSIKPLKKVDGVKTHASDLYKCELVTPVLTYREDIETLQELIRKLRKGGAFVDEGSCGIHIHLNGADHTPRSIRNFINIIASKNDLLYKSLQIDEARTKWCKKMDKQLVETMNKKKPATFSQIENIWYAGFCESRNTHYHKSRYHFLNLHSFFHGNHTVELRGFNSTLHAGKIRSYIVLALALNHQALTQQKASTKKNQTENEKFAMRTYLNRIGLVGDEFKNCREHLCKHLNGSAAWRNGTVA